MNENRTAWALALAGYLPFGLPVLALLFLHADVKLQYAGFLSSVLKVYGALILSFLGGIRWGMALTDPAVTSRARNLLLSVVPSLWAGASLLFAGWQTFVMLAVGFIAMGIWDYTLKDVPETPKWFVTLRLVLTALVAPTLLVAALVTL